MEFEETLTTLGFHPATGRTPKGVQVLTAEPNAFLTYSVQKLVDGAPAAPKRSRSDEPVQREI